MRRQLLNAREKWRNQRSPMCSSCCGLQQIHERSWSFWSAPYNISDCTINQAKVAVSCFVLFSTYLWQMPLSVWSSHQTMLMSQKEGRKNQKPSCPSKNPLWNKSSNVQTFVKGREIHKPSQIGKDIGRKKLFKQNAARTMPRRKRRVKSFLSRMFWWQNLCAYVQWQFWRFLWKWMNNKRFLQLSIKLQKCFF